MKFWTRKAVGRALAALSLLLACAFAPTAAFADTVNCTQIVALPYTISVSGNYCLGGNLSTNTAGVQAILVNTDRVVIDCNNYEIAYTGAAANSAIRGVARNDVEIRNCHFRNFSFGINFPNPNRRMFVHDNKVGSASSTGIVVVGRENVVDRNEVSGVTGSIGIQVITSIDGSSVVRDNVVHSQLGAVPALVGIEVKGGGRNFLRNNVVRNVGQPTSTTAVAIRVGNEAALIPSPAVIMNGGLFAGNNANSKAVQNLEVTAKSVCEDVGLFGYGPTGNPGCL